jgi:preprotein translocase subunit SecG
VYLSGVLNVLLVLCSIFLIFLVLIQRGKGGGLAGAFGGPGGSSAFGAKTSDVFTKVTVWTAGIWIVIAMLLVLLVNRGGARSSAWGESPSSSTRKAPLRPGSPTGTPSGKTSDLEPTPPGSPTPAPDTSPKQPVNPGDPLAPLPPPEPKR